MLLAAAAGNLLVIGLDPGIRIGVKVAVVSVKPRPWSTRTARGATGTARCRCRRSSPQVHGVDREATSNGTASHEGVRLDDLDAALPDFADQSRSTAGDPPRQDRARGAAPVAGTKAASLTTLRKATQCREAGLHLH